MRTIFFTHGLSLLGLAFFLQFPIVIEMNLKTQDWYVFALTAFGCIFLGGLMALTNKGSEYKLTLRHAYFLTITLWASMIFFGALPFYFTDTTYHLSFTDAIFESTSALTTTGSTVYAGLDNAPKGILLWRGLLQGIGGMGIIVSTMIVLPYLRVGGMQLFQMESSDRSDKILPKVHQIALVTIVTFWLLCALCTIAYYWGGMSWFDAITHAMPTIATGGFSTHDASFAYFNKPVLEWLGALFMIAGATPTLLYYSLIIGHVSSRPLLAQAKAYWVYLIVIILVMAVYVHITLDKPWEEALRQTTFNLSSIATTTGFMSTDYALWGAFPVMMFYLVTSIGGCMGSTAGGIKIFRFQVIAKMLAIDIKRLVTPHGIFSAYLGGKLLTDSIMRSVAFFFLMYVMVFTIVALGLAFAGLDMLTSFSGTAQALAGVGPGLGPVIGPAYNFSGLPDMAKWFLTFGMFAGRLEIVTLFVIFSRKFWQDF